MKWIDELRKRDLARLQKEAQEKELQKQKELELQQKESVGSEIFKKVKAIHDGARDSQKIKGQLKGSVPNWDALVNLSDSELSYLLKIRNGEAVVTDKRRTVKSIKHVDKLTAKEVDQLNFKTFMKHLALPNERIEDLRLQNDEVVSKKKK